MMDVKYFFPKSYQAKEMFELMKLLDQESPYLMYEKDSRNKIYKGMRFINMLINSCEKKIDFFLGASIDTKTIGYTAAVRGRHTKLLHMAQLEIGILEKYHHLGIATQMMKFLDLWAENENIKRLELNVIAENHKAIRLYLKCGYQIEGRRRSAAQIDGNLVDELHMAKLF